MIFNETKLKGAFIITIEKRSDERGFFGRAWCQKEFDEQGLIPTVVQANVSYNKKKETLRGIHYQKHPYEETKLVRCTRGAVYDVIIDLRPGSPTYKQWIGEELSADNYTMLYVPKNFGHGFITLEDDTEVTYQVSQFYTPGAEKGIRWDDPAFNIQWPVAPLLVSKKDRAHPDFNDIISANDHYR